MLQGEEILSQRSQESEDDGEEEEEEERRSPQPEEESEDEVPAIFHIWYRDMIGSQQICYDFIVCIDQV